MSTLLPSHYQTSRTQLAPTCSNCWWHNSCCSWHGTISIYINISYFQIEDFAHQQYHLNGFFWCSLAKLFLRIWRQMSRNTWWESWDWKPTKHGQLMNISGWERKGTNLWGGRCLCWAHRCREEMKVYNDAYGCQMLQTFPSLVKRDNKAAKRTNTKERSLWGCHYAWYSWSSYDP